MVPKTNATTQASASRDRARIWKYAVIEQLRRAAIRTIFSQPCCRQQADLFLPSRIHRQRQQRALGDDLGHSGLPARFERGLRELRHGALEPCRSPCLQRRLDRGLATEMNERLDASRGLVDRDA